MEGGRLKGGRLIGVNLLYYKRISIKNTQWLLFFCFTFLRINPQFTLPSLFLVSEYPFLASLTN